MVSPTIEGRDDVTFRVEILSSHFKVRYVSVMKLYFFKVSQFFPPPVSRLPPPLHGVLCTFLCVSSSGRPTDNAPLKLNRSLSWTGSSHRAAVLPYALCAQGSVVACW